MSDELTKLERYRDLVRKRKACSLCAGLCNPANVNGGEYDSEHIGPWSLWQANLDAELVVVGQDWGDIAYFKKWSGRDQASGNPTNENLQELMKIVGVKIEGPCVQQDQVVFFTNLILCLKTGGLQGAVDNDWFRHCSQAFFKPLMDIIKPRGILALGKKVSESILTSYDIPYSKHGTLSKIMGQSPYRLTKSTVLFPLYHCGAGGINRNRSMLRQKEDWLVVNRWLQNKQ